jgi:hypothetical protein
MKRSSLANYPTSPIHDTNLIYIVVKIQTDSLSLISGADLGKIVTMLLWINRISIGVTTLNKFRQPKWQGAVLSTRKRKEIR